METSSDSITLVEQLVVESGGFVNFYGTIATASKYFSQQLHGELWSLKDELTLRKALITATSIIETLNFIGQKTEPSQLLSFPRSGSLVVPQAIEEATYELGLALLKGVQAETEYANTFVSSRQFGKVRTDYDYGRQAPEYLVAGVSSKLAWNKLQPYLADNLGISLSRGA